MVNLFSVGDRVAIDEGKRLGTLAFLGPTKFRPGNWAGIELDTPSGKHDGMVDGVRYFHCNANHGIFVHPSKLLHVRRRSINSPNGNLLPEKISSPKKLHSPHKNSSRRAEKLGGEFQSPRKFEKHRNYYRERTNDPHKEGPTIDFLSAKKISDANNDPSPFLNSDNLPPKNSSLDDDEELAELESELKKRSLELSNAKRKIDEIRMQLAGPQNVPDYIENRNRLLVTFDYFDKASGKYERQLKRIHIFYAKHARMKQTRPDPQLENKLKAYEREKADWLQEKQEIKQRMQRDQSNLKQQDERIADLEQEIQKLYDENVELDQKLRQQSSINAEITLDKSTLKKELGEVKEKFTALLMSDDVERKEKQISALQSKLDEKEDEWAHSQKEKEILIERLGANKQELQEKLYELEKALEMTEKSKEVTESENAKLKDQIKELEASVASPSLTNGSLSNSGKSPLFIDKMEEDHRLQLEKLRQSLEYNWNTYQSTLKGKDEKIENLKKQLETMQTSKLSRSPLTPPPNTNTDASLIEHNEHLQNQLERKQQDYQDLLRAKEIQEEYFQQEIQKMLSSKNASNSAESATIKSPSSSFAERDHLLKVLTETQKENELFARQIEEMMAKGNNSVSPSNTFNASESFTKLSTENEEMRKEIEILENENHRLHSEAQKMSLEITNLHARLHSNDVPTTTQDAREIEMEKESMDKEIRNLNRELESFKRDMRNMVVERNDLRQKLRGQEQQTKRIEEMESTIEGLKTRIKVIDELLEDRSDEVARLESTLKVQKESLKAEEIRNLNLQKQLRAEQSKNELKDEIPKGKEMMEREKKAREQAEQQLKHQMELVDLAQQEMESLQLKITSLEQIDQQKRDLSLKLQRQRDEFVDLQHKYEKLKSSQASTNTNEANVPGAHTSSSGLQKQVENLKKLNATIEHEKILLEQRVEKLQLKLEESENTDLLNKQKRALIKANRVITGVGLDADGDNGSLGTEMQNEGWLSYLKSVASFTKTYKPTQVDLSKLKSEYDEVMSDLQSSSPNMARDTREEGNTFDESEFSVAKDSNGLADGDTIYCVICKKRGHGAGECLSTTSNGSLTNVKRLIV